MGVTDALLTGVFAAHALEMICSFFFCDKVRRHNGLWKSWRCLASRAFTSEHMEGHGGRFRSLVLGHSAHDLFHLLAVSRRTPVALVLRFAQDDITGTDLVQTFFLRLGFACARRTNASVATRIFSRRCRLFDCLREGHRAKGWGGCGDGYCGGLGSGEIDY